MVFLQEPVQFVDLFKKVELQGQAFRPVRMSGIG